MLSAAATAQPVAVSASTVRGQRRRHAAGSRPAAAITTASQRGTADMNASSLRPTGATIAISTVATPSTAAGGADSSRLSSESMIRRYPRSPECASYHGPMPAVVPRAGRPGRSLSLGLT